jgi:hypothetical protein
VLTDITCETGGNAMKMRLTSLITIIALVSAMVLVPLGAEVNAQAYEVKNNLKNIPVEGALSDGGTFEGRLTILGFTVPEPGTLEVTGLLDGTATKSTGEVTRFQNEMVTFPVDSFAVPEISLQQGPNEPGVCDILFLDLGPIFLDILGLTVDLSQIILDVDAVPGEGNLLGNLLCAIVNLLNP